MSVTEICEIIDSIASNVAFIAATCAFVWWLVVKLPKPSKAELDRNDFLHRIAEALESKKST